LAQLAVGRSGTVVRVSDEDPAMLRYLAELSILPGKRITVKARAPYDGPITLLVGPQELSIGPALAANVLIAPLADRPRRRG
ncbi:MAG TPA: FeoA family protein, partial [Gemmatimonadaceae bacterium]